jgi:hypothetical protein
MTIACGIEEGVSQLLQSSEYKHRVATAASLIMEKLAQAGPRSYKKDDVPLLNLTGAMSRCSREKVLMCTQKKELESPL